MYVPWLTRLVDVFLPRRTGFDPKSVHVRSVVAKVLLAENFPLSTSVFSRKCHSTNTLYTSL